jgi:hypothetical protein
MLFYRLIIYIINYALIISICSAVLSNAISHVVALMSGTVVYLFLTTCVELSNITAVIRAQVEVEQHLHTTTVIQIPPPDAATTTRNNATTECSICLGSDEGSMCVIPKCTHMFHTECVLKWSKISRTCPTCRGGFDSLELIL